MAIVQISKIQIRTGAEADLPQLDIGELGFATDTKTAYIGNDPLLDPPVGIEPTLTQLLTDSPNCHINASQLTGIISIDVGNLKIGGGRNGFVLKTDGTGNLSWGGAGGGVSGGGDISNSLDTQLLFNSGDEIYGDSNLVYNKTTQVLNLTGTLNATNLAGNITTSTQTNITRLGTLVNLAVTGNIVSGNANLGNLVTSNYFSGNGSLLTGVVLSSTAGTVVASSQPNITSVSTLTSLTVSGISTLGLAANVKIGGGNPGQLLTTDGAGNLSWASVSGGGSPYGNANVASYLNSGFFNTTFIGSIPNAVHANYADVANSVAGGNVTGQVANALLAGTVYTSAQPNITSVGTLTSLLVTGDINTLGDITLIGTLDAINLRGNGRQISSLVGANVTGTVANATYAISAGSAGSANTISWSGIADTPTTLSGYGITNTYGPIFSAYLPGFAPLSPFVSGGIGKINPLKFQTKAFDSDNCYDAVTGRFTPTRSGYYQVTAQTMLNSAEGTTKTISNLTHLRKNDNIIVKEAGAGSAFEPITATPVAFVTGIVYMNGTTDYLTVDVQYISYAPAGSLFYLVGNSPTELSGPATFFEASWIRP